MKAFGEFGGQHKSTGGAWSAVRMTDRDECWVTWGGNDHLAKMKSIEGTAVRVGIRSLRLRILVSPSR